MRTDNYAISNLMVLNSTFTLRKQITHWKKCLKTIYFVLYSEAVKSETIFKSNYYGSTRSTLKTQNFSLGIKWGCWILLLLYMLHLFPYTLSVSFPKAVQTPTSVPSYEWHGLIMQCLNKIFSFISFQFSPSSSNQCFIVLLFTL